jgi:hypothetical protein
MVAAWQSTRMDLDIKMRNLITTLLTSTRAGEDIPANTKNEELEKDMPPPANMVAKR